MTTSLVILQQRLWQNPLVTQQNRLPGHAPLYGYKNIKDAKNTNKSSRM